MAGSSLFTLIDDIASLLDDVSMMSKVALKKTAGVLGDDLALNAEQVTGVHRDRELPVVWAVAKGSLWNKAILVPAALVISWLTPWLIGPLLMLGGLFLVYEGVHKILHSFHKRSHTADTHADAASDTPQFRSPSERAEFERDKISGAIRTDFILSAEIIVITLGTLTETTFLVRLTSLVAVALLITIGVYGLVAGIVKMDDLGVHLFTRKGEGFWLNFQRRTGRLILWFAPWLMRLLSFAGTVAMFLVGGGIIAHTFHSIEEAIHHTEEVVARSFEFAAWLTGPVLEGLLGLVAGAIVAVAIAGLSIIWKQVRPDKTEPTPAGEESTG